MQPFEQLVEFQEGLVSPTQTPFNQWLHVGADNIRSGGGLIRDLQTCEQLGLTSGKYPFRSGAIIYSKIRPYLNKVCRVDFEGVCSADAYPLYVREDELKPNFLVYLMRSDRFVSQAVATSMRTGMPKINRQDLGKLEIPVPPLPEQQKIADILGTWDAALEKLEALIAAKARRKQALMRQLLAVAAQKVGHGHARHRFGEIVERVTRKNTVGNDNVLTISAQDGLINQREYFNRSVAGADLSGYFLLRRGEFAYNRSSSIGFPYGAIKRLDRYDSGVVSTLYLCFRLRDKAQASSDYLAHYLDGGFLNPGLRSVAKEGARAHGLLNITADEFLDIDILLPPLPVQKKISSILDTADAELRLLRQQRVALDQQKRGLMQKLLTGKIRVSTKS